MQPGIDFLGCIFLFRCKIFFMESRFKLIDGEFSVEEAREVIGNLFEFKINFHSKQSFSTELRTGSKDEKSLSRKESLKLQRTSF